jgi:Calcineurin-like phosphoesterase
MAKSEAERQALGRREFIGLCTSFCAAAVASRVRGDVAPIDAGSWTLVLLPDTQHYAETYPHIYDAQTQWIADHAKSHNIKYVLHEGDVTNQNLVEQWDNALRSMNRLNDAVPYAIAPGNHDYGPKGTCTDRNSFFNESKYFGPGSFYSKQPSIGAFFDPKLTSSSYHTFDAGGKKWLVLALDWAPRDEIVAWANNVVAAHPDHLAMLVTHAYLYYDDTRYNWASKDKEQTWNPHAYGMAKLPGESVNDGQQLWDKLVSRHKNFRFAFNGHVLVDGTGFLSSTGEHGNFVHQMLANYQFKKNGGNGDMRLLEFKSDGDTLAVRTYSPHLDRFDEEYDQQFAVKMSEPHPPLGPAVKKQRET